jgi:hypothetical protein
MSGERSKNSIGRRERRDFRPKAKVSVRSQEAGEATAKPQGLVQKIAGLVQGMFGKSKSEPVQEKRKGVETPGPAKAEEAIARRKRPMRSRRQSGRVRESEGSRGTAPAPLLQEPTAEEVTTPRLYVGNLSYEAAESDLFDLFSQVGPVKNVQLIRERKGTRSKGYGFVEMADLEAARQAVLQLHRKEFMGRQLVVSGAKGEARKREAS